MTARRRITPALVRRLALRMPESFESSHFSRPDFRVHNKIFATLPPDGQTVVLRLRRRMLTLSFWRTRLPSGMNGAVDGLGSGSIVWRSQYCAI